MLDVDYNILTKELLVAHDMVCVNFGFRSGIRSWSPSQLGASARLAPKTAL